MCTFKRDIASSRFVNDLGVTVHFSGAAEKKKKKKSIEESQRTQEERPPNN